MSNHRSWGGAELSVAAACIWGKSGAEPSTWLPLWRHLADAAGIADLLWRHWVPQRARDLITTSLELTDDEARRLISWLAGIHDIGKATPSFVVMQPELAARGRPHGLTVKAGRKSYDDLAHHTLTGQLIVERWLQDRHGVSRRRVDQLGCVVGGHHGVPPSPEALADLELCDPGAIGGSAWESVQAEILDWATDSAGVGPVLTRLAPMNIPAPVQVLLTAMVIVADWIASDERNFPYRSGLDPVQDADRIAHGWSHVDLPPRWTATDVPTEVADLYRLRFGIAAPFPVQDHAARIAANLTEPAMVIIEAPMGEGKTEAALAMAEIVAGRTGDGGVVVALPTQATGNAILRRFTRWLAKLPRDADVVFDVGLAHGKAGQNRHYRRLRSAGYRAIDVDGDRSRPTMAAHHWLAGRKRVMLSQFVVGTIDQILFAALKARHIALRHLGLAGKVVVIDEAHAYDIYMSQYLHRVIEWLGEYGCTVIVLSATLPADKRAELVAAYQGRPPAIEPDDDLQYPLITTATRTGETTRHPVETSQRHTEVAVEYLDEPEEAEFEPLVKLLDEALADGGCALVVRNTVARAMATAAVLRGRFGAEVTLAHSRFIAPDRAAKDDALVAEFGRDRVMDGRRRIVVSTQVCEQSLDLDFDLLITDLAPIDLMLQRMGRMHRHERGERQSQRPERLRSARCVVAGAQWTGNIPVPVAGSTRVYHHYQLLRAAAALHDRSAIELPDDIPHLVDAAYRDEPIGPAHWHTELDRLRERFRDVQSRKEFRARSYLLAPADRQRSLSGWIDAGIGDSDDTLAGYQQVRDSVDSLEVLMLVERDDQWFTPWWIEENPDSEVSRAFEPGPGIARTAAACSISLPFWLDYDALVADLERISDIPAWRGCHWLDGQLVLPLDSETLSTTVGKYRLHYDVADGLTVREVDG